MAGDPYPGYYLARTEYKPIYRADGGEVSYIRVKTYKRNNS